MTDAELIAEIEAQRALMVAVATGGPRIQEVNAEYTARRHRIQDGLAERGLTDPNPHTDLWRWYGKWSSDLPSYQSRRVFVSDLYQPLLERLHTGGASVGSALFPEPTGWARVDRGIDLVRRQLETASSEEQFQSVGLLCREVLISLAQATYDDTRHPSLDGVAPSATDAKRKLEAVIAVELAGGSQEAARKHARAALDLANDLQHSRTANFRAAAMCAEATSAVMNTVAIAVGRRDPIA